MLKNTFQFPLNVKEREGNLIRDQQQNSEPQGMEDVKRLWDLKLLLNDFEKRNESDVLDGKTRALGLEDLPGAAPGVRGAGGVASPLALLSLLCSSPPGGALWDPMQLFLCLRFSPLVLLRALVSSEHCWGCSTPSLRLGLAVKHHGSLC